MPDIVDQTTNLSDIEFTESDIYRIMSTLDISKAKGIDGLGPNILKFCVDALYEPLFHLFRCTISQEQIPTEWRLHKITPLHKAGDINDVSNYRPISLLCTVSKVLEKLICEGCMDFLSGSISPFQFGFTKHRSSLQQMLLFYSEVFESLNSGIQTDVIFLDFAKAFDSVPHAELLFKLRQRGIGGKLWKWFMAYLANRMQCVCVEGVCSNFLPVKSGVPQGSLLGPLLFLIYINDLQPVTCRSRLYLFADNTKCHYPVTSLHDCQNMQDDLNSLSEWSQTWKLLFKHQKCTHLAIHSGKLIESTYCMNGNAIATKETHRDLGVVISSNCSWEPHHDHIIARAYRTLGLLRRIFHHVNSVQRKKQLYISLVQSQFLYCSPIWRPCLIKDIVKLERVQRKATKFILSNYSLDYPVGHAAFDVSTGDSGHIILHPKS